ncbi:MAG: hypothetical protein JWR61_1909 [Ferruginibacter sp.]|nr:hypothetical protein [Ferruginibacter sp.]
MLIAWRSIEWVTMGAVQFVYCLIKFTNFQYFLLHNYGIDLHNLLIEVHGWQIFQLFFTLSQCLLYSWFCNGRNFAN